MLPLPGPHDALFVDFDGTLVDIAPRPSAVRVDPRVPKLLIRLAERLGGAVSIVSGRPIIQVARYLQPYNGAMVGIYGLERRDALGRMVTPVPIPELRTARRALADFANAHPGVVLEDKGIALALHYRSNPRQRDACEAIADEVAYASNGRLVVAPGKMVVEIHPSGATKGRAISEMLDQPPFRGRRPIYVGDDRPDEVAFDVVNQVEGISVFVGAGKESVARYRLADVPAVIAWLEAAAYADEASGARSGPTGHGKHFQ